MLNFARLISITGLVAVVHAHFQLQFPLPRGVFVEDNEPDFCDGYDNAVNNRTTFPLSNGIFSLNSEHPQWSADVMVSTVQNPTSFDNFSQSQLAVQPFKMTGEGIFCFPINLTASGVDGVKDGANVTIQIQYNGGDGNLFQCADLTLSSTASISNVSCTNATGTSASSSGALTHAAIMNYLMAFAIGLAGVALASF